MTKATQKRFIIVLVNHRTRKPIIDQYHFSLKIQNKRNLSAEHLSRVWLFVDGQLAAHYSNLRIGEAAKVTTTREREREMETVSEEEEAAARGCSTFSWRSHRLNLATRLLGSSGSGGILENFSRM